METEQQKFTDALISCIETFSAPDRLKESVLYSIRAGGKRIRPILMKLMCKGLNGDEERIYPAAIALEMVHTYSLIHDDLPAMDDDEFRRGQLTNHKKFDEATAILAGDGLLANSFQLITQAECYSDREKSYIVSMLAQASGLEGMVAGQYLDMQAENREISIAELEQIHRLKTGRLISFAIEVGGFLAKASVVQMQKIKVFGDYVGLIFQIQDDILDVEGDQAITGKQIGSDAVNDKSTYTSLLGLEGAKQHKEQYVSQAMEALRQLELEHSDLARVCQYISERNQ
nr:farnesyl diphosphate synthase [Gracilibacillus alcaliphilus]